MHDCNEDDAIPASACSYLIDSLRLEFGDALVAIVVGGSRVRGDWNRSSDLDVHVVHRGDWQQKRVIDSSDSGLSVDLDITIDPLEKLQDWFGRFRGYADFYGSGRVVYPERAGSDLHLLLRIAKATMSIEPEPGYDSEEHHKRYRYLMRTVERGIEADPVDQYLAASYVLAGLAALRLVIAGEHHIKAHSLITQVSGVDEQCAKELLRLSAITDPRHVLVECGSVLRAMSPRSRSLIGARR